MRHAVERGVNWIDTAAVYGLGHSEELVGRLLRELQPGERPLVFTKCGLVWDDCNPMKEARRVLKPESLRHEAEASLRRLGVERIDWYQFHWPDETGTPIEDSWQAMVRLVEAGKVRAAGVSNFDVALLARCEAIRHVDSLQPPFSLIRREAAAGEIPWCAEHGTGVICYSPMQSGLLGRETGRRLTPEDVTSIQQAHATAFRRQVSTVRPLPGAVELLAYLSRSRVHWAIATSGRLESARPLLEMLGVAPDVPVITRDQVEHAKPDPDLFLAAAERLGADVAASIVVGDSVWDLLAARRAQALGVGLLSGGYGQDELERAGAYRVYQDPADLLRHLDEVGVRL